MNRSNSDTQTCTIVLSLALHKGLGTAVTRYNVLRRSIALIGVSLKCRFTREQSRSRDRSFLYQIASFILGTFTVISSCYGGEITIIGEGSVGYSDNINLNPNSDLAEEAGTVRARLSLIGTQESPTHQIDSDLSLVHTTYVETERNDQSEMTGTLIGSYEHIPEVLRSSLSIVAEKPLPAVNFEGVTSDQEVDVNANAGIEGAIQFGHGNSVRAQVNYDYLDRPSANPSYEERASITGSVQRQSTQDRLLALTTTYSKPTKAKGSDIYNEFAYGARIVQAYGNLITSLDGGFQKIENETSDSDIDSEYVNAELRYASSRFSEMILSYSKNNSNRSQGGDIVDSTEQELIDRGEIQEGSTLAETNEYSFELNTQWNLTQASLTYSLESVDFLSTMQNEETESTRLEISHRLTPQLQLIANTRYSEVTYVNDLLGKNKDLSVEISAVNQINEDISVRLTLTHLDRSNRDFPGNDYKEFTTLIAASVRLY